MRLRSGAATDPTSSPEGVVLPPQPTHKAHGSKGSKARGSRTRKGTAPSAAPVTAAEDTTTSFLRVPEVSAVLMADGGLNTALINDYLDNVDVEVESRVRSLRWLGESHVLSLRNLFNVTLMKLPHKIRQMPVNEFREKFGGNLMEVIVEDVARAMDEVGATTPREHIRDFARGKTTEIPPTPTPKKPGAGGRRTARQPQRGKNKIPASSSRGKRKAGDAVVEDEQLDGSATSRSRHSLESEAHPQLPRLRGFVLELDDGNSIDLSEISRMGQETKEKTLTKLQDLQKQMTAIMQQLK